MSEYLEQYLEVTLLSGEVTKLFYPYLTVVYERYEHHLQRWNDKVKKWKESNEKVPIVVLQFRDDSRYHVLNSIDNIQRQINIFKGIPND